MFISRVCLWPDSRLLGWLLDPAFAVLAAAPLWSRPGGLARLARAVFPLCSSGDGRAEVRTLGFALSPGLGPAPPGQPARLSPWIVVQATALSPLARAPS